MSDKGRREGRGLRGWWGDCLKYPNKVEQKRGKEKNKDFEKEGNCVKVWVPLKGGGDG